MFVKVEYLGFYPLGSEVKLNGVKIMKSEWNSYNKILIPYGKKHVISPLFCRLYYVVYKESIVFFAAYEYGLGHYHIFKLNEKANRKLSSRISIVKGFD